ncbi:MAG: hypothetical protein HFG34_10835 [Eubacterium sp.]|nr:hypothetical protein [Eubacterium sp.]
MFGNSQPINEYTAPLSGEIVSTCAGVIKARGCYGEKYSVGKIEYQLFSETGYQYVISPYWDVVDGLGEEGFQGIPGIAMELRRQHYYRVNRQPVFISMRSPSENREDLEELLEAAGMDTYDRLEWLVRTQQQGGDHLTLEPYRQETREFCYNGLDTLLCQLQYGDLVRISSQNEVSNNPSIYTEHLLCMVASGAVIRFEKEKIVIDKNTRSTILSILQRQYYAWKNQQILKHRRGVEGAKNRGAYRGRRPMQIEPGKIQKVSDLFHAKKISEAEAMQRLGIVSRSTFYRKLKELKM